MSVHYPNSVGKLPLTGVLNEVIHRFTENLQEAVDKLWKGVATASLTWLTQSCSIFNHLGNKAWINQRLRLTVAKQQGRVQA
ncbi:hypothetical protein GCM10011382_31510 [Vreelandella lutescens]|uniref:Uncharacterized protein n=1 Tax=Vreelandella lutescens TaxID=1602943 RepID=A0ABQ1PK62_9GAMM|nr:hypothetical protein GCM10011382_31510 [Halomonas lutescens]